MKKKIKKANKKAKSTTLDDGKKADAVTMTNDSKKTRSSVVNYDEFVRVWRSASSVSDVALALGIKRNSATAIAARLRASGVTALRSFPKRSKQPIDVTKLNKIAAGKIE